MRKSTIVPPTDVRKLVTDVLSRGALGAMPRNLPDRWLRAIVRDNLKAEIAQRNGKLQDCDAYLAATFLLVSALQSHKHEVERTPADLTENEILQGVSRFSAALKDELIGRETGVFMHQYDIHTIV